MLKIALVIIDSNIYISLAAVFLCVATQIQLGMEPQWHPYLFIIFFATLFEYNLNALILVFTNQSGLHTSRYNWLRENPVLFSSVIIISVVGFTIAALFAMKKVLFVFLAVALLTVFYLVPILKIGNKYIRLREIPYLKIFLIALVWSFSTTLLPVVQSPGSHSQNEILVMLAERFLFIFAITIPFDVRDQVQDKKSGLKTIPLLINEKNSFQLACVVLLIFCTVSFIHYFVYRSFFMGWALVISGATTFMFLRSHKIRNLRYYHYAVLDGTMLLQGLLVIFFYYLCR
jgi:4-hydroxybenzoate polyprenyltransferase